ncbi:MAG: cupredoxin domain-containing protein [Patescibacteria group bacterium]|nr:cupredoxin domain-containing protein [Patescibacteria group bacterium]
MITHRHIWLWIVGGIAVAAVLIYFSLSNGVLTNFLDNSPFSQGSSDGKAGSTAGESAVPIAPQGVSYDQTESTLQRQDVVVTGTPEVPGQSLPVLGDTIPKSAIKISIVRGAGFSPSSFTVKAGETVVVSITADENRSHTFVFDEPSLSSVAVGVAPHETRVITFIAPAKKGDYIFRDNVFGATETGKMIVK